MSEAVQGWMLIIAMSLAAYYGVPALFAAFLHMLEDARAHRERVQEDLDELLRMELLEIVEREHEESRNGSSAAGG